MTKQESPPVWMQETYWPWHIKYSICYPVWGGVTPIGVPLWPGLMGRGVPPPRYPPARSDRGYSRWGTPLLGYPPPGLMGGSRGQVPPSRVSPLSDLAVVAPHPHWTWQGYIPPPSDLTGVPPRCEQTENITFPRTTYAVSKDQNDKSHNKFDWCCCLMCWMKF